MVSLRQHFVPNPVTIDSTDSGTKRQLASLLVLRRASLFFHTTYDNLGRLVREVFDSSDDSLDFTDQYTFDLVSNRLAKLHDQGSDDTIDEAVTYSYDKNDRLLTETLDAPGGADDRFTVYEYGEGNSGTQQTRKTVHAGLDDSGPVKSDTRYRYNRQGRLWIAEIDSDGDGSVDTTTEHEYNDAGIRVSQTVNGEKTLYLVDHNNPTGYAQVVAEIAAATQELLRTYTLGLDVIDQATITAAAQAVVNYLLYDGHGSTRGLVDALGQPLAGQVFAYDAYGNAVGFNPASALTSLLYSGEQVDGATGLQYLRARYYDLATGRFMRVDPFFGDLRSPLSLHKYLLCNADSVNNTDPSGWSLSSAQITVVAIAASLGAIVGGYVGYREAGVPGMIIGGVLGAVTGALAGLGFVAPAAVLWGVGVWKSFFAAALVDAIVFGAHRAWGYWGVPVVLMAEGAEMTEQDIAPAVAEMKNHWPTYPKMRKLVDNLKDGTARFRVVPRNKWVEGHCWYGNMFVTPTENGDPRPKLTMALKMFAEFQHHPHGGQMNEGDAQEEFKTVRQMLPQELQTEFIMKLHHGGTENN
jgi:RHS repeat-associated protein